MEEHSSPSEESWSQSPTRQLGTILETLCFSVRPKGLLKVIVQLQVSLPYRGMHDKKWKCSAKVKYRREWECLGCCGENVRGSGNDDSSNSVQVQ